MGQQKTEKTTSLTRIELEENNALPHHNCSGSQLFWTLNPTTPLPRTQIQSEAATTREAKLSSVDCCENHILQHEVNMTAVCVLLSGWISFTVNRFLSCFFLTKKTITHLNTERRTLVLNYYAEVKQHLV